MSNENSDLAVRLVILWLSRYVRLSRASPALVDRLRARTDEFEMVPIPRRLLNSVAAAGAPEGPRTANSAAIDPEEPEDGLTSFAAAISRGDLEEAVTRLHPAYLDSDGRQLSDLRKILERALEATVSRELAIERIETDHRDSFSAALTVHCRWRARLAQTSEEASAIEESITLSVDLQRESTGWLISGMTSLETPKPNEEAAAPPSEGEASP